MSMQTKLKDYEKNWSMVVQNSLKNAFNYEWVEK